jgi:hydroxymethylpyrimidine pyrophosphatase-like HAD family hydrolase
MKLWVFNVDGVLLSNHGPLIEDTARAIHDLQQKGNLCTIATDSTGIRVWETMDKFSPNAPLIVEGGARIVGARGQTIAVHPLAERVLEALRRVLDEQPVVLAALITRSGRCRVFTSYAVVDPPRSIHAAVEKITQDSRLFIAWAKEGCTSIVLMTDGENALIPPQGIKWRQDAEYYTIVARGVNKGTALLDLARHVAIALEDTFVVAGDESDLPMFKLRDVGGKICVGSACPELVKRATHLVESPETLGAAIRRRYL